MLTVSLVLAFCIMLTRAALNSTLNEPWHGIAQNSFIFGYVSSRDDVSTETFRTIHIFLLMNRLQVDQVVDHDED